MTQEVLLVLHTDQEGKEEFFNIDSADLVIMEQIGTQMGLALAGEEFDQNLCPREEVLQFMDGMRRVNTGELDFTL